MSKLNIISETKTIDIDSINKPTMSSREIAELTGKQHNNVLADIRKMLNELSLSTADFSVMYKADNGQEYELFNLPKQIADFLLNRYKGLNRVLHRLREESSLKTIEQLLGISLIRQYKVLNYRIDGYDPVSNTAYEIDEPEHNGKETKDAERQSKIEKILKCTFVRIKL